MDDDRLFLEEEELDYNVLQNDVLQNFPFVEGDVDSITDYQLFSLGFGYLDEKKADKSELPNLDNYVTKEDLNSYTKTDDLAEVALTGKYVDLKNKPVIPNKTSQLVNDSGYIDKDVNDLTYYTLSSNLASVATSGDYDDLTNKPTIPDVSNFITKDVNDLTYYTLSSNLASVATSGSYTDLSNKPTIPDVSNFITKDVNNLTYYTLSSNLASVATSGSYADLSNKPTIPSVTVGSFTPTILGLSTDGTATYTTQEGRYVKINNVLHIEIKLTCQLDSSSGYVAIRGFPTNLGTLHDAGICSVVTDLTTASEPLYARVYYTQYLLLQNATGSAYSNHNWSSNKNIYLSGTFILD